MYCSCLLYCYIGKEHQYKIDYLGHPRCYTVIRRREKMNKLGETDYLVLISESLVATYGNTLIENACDLEMSYETLKRLRKYLYFHPVDMSKRDFREWRKEFLIENNLSEEYIKEEINRSIKVYESMKKYMKNHF